MTKEAFILEHRHEWGGWIADALVTHRTGAPLACWQRECFRKIDAELGKIYDQLKREFQVQMQAGANGAPANIGSDRKESAPRKG